MHVKSTAVTAYTNLSNVGRQINFNVTIDGVAGTAIVRVHDHGEPGRDDRFEIQLSNGYSAGGELGGDRPGGGNIQLHVKDCGGQGGSTGGGPGGSTGGSTGGGPGGTTGGGGAEGACPLTIGYWKNHNAHLSQLLGAGAIALGDRSVSSAAEALTVLNAAS